MTQTPAKTIAIIGGGPAGLMAAGELARKGHRVELFEAKPSLARKFQLAGRGGLNLTHSEPIESFVRRYGKDAGFFAEKINRFAPQDLRDFCDALGQETFVGSSGRVFPTAFKATALLRAWIAHLTELGVTIHTRHRWLGFDDAHNPVVAGPDGEEKTWAVDATLLALGGASWPRMGSDGAWVPTLKKHGVEIQPLAPANCGFEGPWAESLPESCFGQPIKNIELRFAGRAVKGEIMLSRYGLEGGAVYALSRDLREALEEGTEVALELDLKPALTLENLLQRLKGKTRGSMTRFLKRDLHLSEAAVELLKARTERETFNDPTALAKAIKALKLPLTAPRPLERAISTAGGITFDSCDDSLMLKALPGVFVAGEMLDWEAPTGGYLLQGCFSMAHFVAEAMDRYLTEP